ncbi:O-antigen ligase family protein [Patescibacteria group bacterium]|nr:O-antigen ligase family protein [Patescibacteria group bacterium]MBU1967122.1 O-antigen ligase family protein [Patescibacteria group bacterium]
MLTKQRRDQLYTAFIVLIIFLIPSNLFLKLNYSGAYVNGLLVDYLIPKIYLNDIFIFTLLVLWLIEVVLVKKNKLKTTIFKPYFSSILISLIIIRQIFAPYPLSAAWYLLKLIEVGLLGWFLAIHKKLLRKPIISYAIIAASWFQSLLAIFQFFTQKSLLSYKFLGEPQLSNSIGLAKDVWWNTGRVLPYSTTAHPNILGGILAIFSLILISWFSKAQNKWIQKLTIFTILLAIFVIILTQSISAGLTLIIGSIFITAKKLNQKLLVIGGIILFIITPIFIHFSSQELTQNDSLIRRSYLQTAAINMFVNNPILGVGLNQFTSRVEEYSNTQEIVRFVQPVHHVGLLWLAETGLLGLGILAWIIVKNKLKKIIIPLLILLPLATLDHYLLTQQAGLLLMTLTIVWFQQKE